MKLLNWFYVLLLLVAGMSFASCSEDNELDNPPTGEEVASQAGDNFYMYVNGAWHNSLNPSEDKDHGFIVDAQIALINAVKGVRSEMEETKILEESYGYLMAGGVEENIAYTDSIMAIIEECVESAQSIEELGNYVGQWVRKGYLENMFRLYSAISKSEDFICYTIAPDNTTLQLMGADSAGDDEEGEEARRPNFSNYNKYTSKTRGGSDFLSSVVAGLDLAPEYFLLEDTVMGVYNSFFQMDLDGLKEMVMEMAISELYIYCGDECTQKVTNGVTASTRTVLDKQINNLLSYPLSYYYCERYVDDNVKAKYSKYAETMREVFAKRIQNNAWLSEATKEKALEKLNNIKFFYAEPDEWNLDMFPKFESNLLAENVMTAKQSRIDNVISMIGKPKRENLIPVIINAYMGMGTYDFNAYHVHETNTVTINNCFMTAPEYTEDMTPAQLYALFYVIGHEMTHGFDIKGSEYDANGNQNNWWTEEDRAKFNALNNALSEQISTFEVEPGIMADGFRTISEDVADLGGLNIALDALNEYMAEKGATEDEVKEAQKEFFERHAYRYRRAHSQAALQIVLQDVHSHDLVRVNGMVQHMDSWYNLYNVTEDNDMYLSADKRITIW